MVELAHHLALNLRPIPTGAGVGGARQRAVSQRRSALQARGMPNTDDIKKRLVEPFSHLHSLHLLHSVALALVSISPDGAQQQPSRHMGLLFR